MLKFTYKGVNTIYHNLSGNHFSAKKIRLKCYISFKFSRIKFDFELQFKMRAEIVKKQCISVAFLKK